MVHVPVVTRTGAEWVPVPDDLPPDDIRLVATHALMVAEAARAAKARITSPARRTAAIMARRVDILRAGGEPAEALRTVMKDAMQRLARKQQQDGEPDLADILDVIYYEGLRDDAGVIVTDYGGRVDKRVRRFVALLLDHLVLNHEAGCPTCAAARDSDWATVLRLCHFQGAVEHRALRDVYVVARIGGGMPLLRHRIVEPAGPVVVGGPEEGEVLRGVLADMPCT